MTIDAASLIETLSAAMRLDEMQAQAVARNIAMNDVPGARLQRFDASGAFAQLRAALADSGQLADAVAAVRDSSVADYLQAPAAQAPSLDDEVAEMASASEHYQALGEGVSRQFALMRLAIGGDK